MGGKYFNFAENNCCKCGLDEAPVSVAPKTTFGCTHTADNSLSKPLVEYCNKALLTKSEC